MANDQTKQSMLFYINNLLSCPIGDEMMEDFAVWIMNYWKRLFNAEFQEATSSREARKIALKTIRAELQKETITDIAQKGYEPLFDSICEMFHIPEEFQPLLRFFFVQEKYRPMVDFYQNVINSDDRKYLGYSSVMSAITNSPASVIKKAARPNSPLTELGVWRSGDNQSRRRLRHNNGYTKPYLELSETFERLFTTDCQTPAEIKNMFFDVCKTAKLTHKDFAHISDEFCTIKTILNNAVKNHTQGINILLYGVPGTGKTEMAKTLAKSINADLVLLSEKTGNYERGDRLDEYCVVKTMLGEDINTILLMDEAEDVFYTQLFGGNSETNSKLFINRMLETNKIPVIWISNNIGSMDNAYLRRFSYALKVPKPDENAKRKIWHSILSEHKMELAPKRVKQYAKQFDVAPALIDTAVRTAALSNSPKMIEKTIESLQTAMLGYVPLPKNEQIYKFDPALSNAAQNLEQVAANLAAKNKRNFSMCLYGAPGTGKSAFARYLAGKLKMKVIQKRSSDLQSMWVGECEKNIAEAFREAKDKKAMLIIDEADSFLQDRTNAQRSWEVSQVGEMLSQMECHPYPFVCTTNLMDSLDRAALRRFTMKIQYHYLTPEQVVLACKRLLHLSVSLDDVKGLDALAPGDFKVVLEQSKILHIRNKPELLSMLREEIKVKEPERKTRVGFGA